MQNELLLNLIQNNVQALWGQVAFTYMCTQSQGGLLATLDCPRPRKLFSVCQVMKALLTNAAAFPYSDQRSLFPNEAMPLLI